MTRTSTQDLQDEFLTALSKGQQTMIGALRIWVDTVQTVTPRLTSIYAPLTDRLPKLPTVSLPFADRLPSPKEAVDGAYGLAEDLLANQRKFAEQVLDTAAPLLPGQQAPKAAAPDPFVVRTDPRPAAPQPAGPKPAEPKPAQPKPAQPKPAQPKPAQPKPAAPKAASPKPTSPKPAPRKATAPKATAPKTAASKTAAPKAAAPKRTPSTPKPADAS
jgi:hypothetical protein